MKELRLRGISTVEAANAYAPAFMAAYNARFAKPPRSDYNAHRPLRADETLETILTWREPRKETKALTVRYDRVLYLLDDIRWRTASLSTDPSRCGNSLSHALQVAQAIQAQRDNRRIGKSPSRTHLGAEVRREKRLPGTKKSREFTPADVDAVILQLGDKQPDKPTRRSARAIA